MTTTTTINFADFAFGFGSLVNLTGHPINVETDSGVITIPPVKVDGKTVSIRVDSNPSSKMETLESGIAIFSSKTFQGLSLVSSNRENPVSIPFNVDDLNGLTPIVSALASSAMQGTNHLVPMTAPDESPTRNEKGWIISVKGLRQG